MKIDLKNEILENEEITIVGQAEFIKQLLFDVTATEEYVLHSDVDFFSDILTLSKKGYDLFIEDTIIDSEFKYHTTEILWLDKDVFKAAYRKGQQKCFLEDRDIVNIY